MILKKTLVSGAVLMAFASMSIAQEVPSLPKDDVFTATVTQTDDTNQNYGKLEFATGEIGIVKPQVGNSGGGAPAFLYSATTGEVAKNFGTIWVVAGELDEQHSYGNYVNGMLVNNGAQAENHGTIFVKSNAAYGSGTPNPESAKAMSSDGNGTLINEGTIVVENATAMAMTTKANGQKIINNGEIYVNSGIGISANINDATGDATTVSFENSGLIEADENSYGVVLNASFSNGTFTNSGSITGAGMSIYAATADNLVLDLKDDSSIKGAVWLKENATISATNLSSTDETLNLVNSSIKELKLTNSTLGFTGEDALHIQTVNFAGDTGSTLVLKDSRSLKADSVTGNAVIESDHVATEGTLIEVGTVAEGGSVSVNFTDDVTNQLSSAEDAKTIAEEQIKVGADGNGEKTVKYEQGNILGEITVNADGTVTEKSNTDLDAYRSVHALSAISWRNEMNDLTKRMGELRDSPEGVGTWVRMYGSEQEYGAQSVTSKSTSIQVGADYDVGAGWKVGGAFTYTDGDATYNDGSADAESYGFAVYGSWFAENGQFVDLIAKYNRMSTDYTLGAMDGSFDNNAWAISAEYGWHFKIADLAFVEPQVELTYGQIIGDDFSAGNGATIEQDDFDSLIGRVGVRGGFYFPENKGNIYLRASVLHDFQGEMESDATNGVTGKHFSDDLGGTWYEVGVGANFNLTDRTYTYVDLEKNAGGEVKENWRWNVGVRHVW